MFGFQNAVPVISCIGDSASDTYMCAKKLAFFRNVIFYQLKVYHLFNHKNIFYIILVLHTHIARMPHNRVAQQLACVLIPSLNNPHSLCVSNSWYSFSLNCLLSACIQRLTYMSQEFLQQHQQQEDTYCSVFWHTDIYMSLHQHCSWRWNLEVFTFCNWIHS